MRGSVLPEAVAPAVPAAKFRAPPRGVWLGMLAFSAVAAMIDGQLLSKLLMRVVGCSAQTTPVVLVAFLAGLGAGALLARRLLRHEWHHPFWRFGLVELGIGTSTLALLPVMEPIARIYALLARPLGAGTMLFVLRFAVAVLLSSAPAVLVGMTLPLFLAAARQTTGDARLTTPRYYAATALGAAFGVLVSTYLLLPNLAIAGVLLIAALCNLAVAITAFALDWKRIENIPSCLAPAKKSEGESWFRREVLVSFTSGLLALALSAIVFRLLAGIVGSTVYASGLMLFVFLAGHGLGSWLAEHKRLLRPLALSLAQAAVGLSILALLPYWDRVPQLFRSVGRFAPSFFLWEATRMAATSFLLLAPALALGCAFGLLLRRESGGARRASRVAQLLVANMTGGILGVVLARCVLAPLLGSQVSLVVIAVAEIAASFLVLAWESPRARRATAVSLIIATVALLATRSSWSMAQLMSGSNVYFDAGVGPSERIRYLAEDSSRGMVTVMENKGTRTLLANGNFVGDDSSQVPDQQLCALFPMLFAHHHGRGLQIGAGTGNTVAVMAAFPFQRLDVVDPSESVLTAARREFRQLNRDVFDDARVHTFVEDGRNFLRIGTDSYDLISVQVSSLSVEGEADCFSVEFYQGARRRLTESGVFKQWLPLHHLSTLDIGRVLASLRAVFPVATLWVGRHQAALVASPLPLRADLRAVERWASNPRLAEILHSAGLEHPYATFGHLYLDTADMDSFLAEVSARHGYSPADLIVHDNRPVLEYSTPRGNLLRAGAVENIEALRRHARVSLLGHVTGAHGEDDQQQLLAWAAYERGFHRLARLSLDRVKGPLSAESEKLQKALANVAAQEWP